MAGCKWELKSGAEIVVECRPADERLLLGVISYSRQRTRDYGPDYRLRALGHKYDMQQKCRTLVGSLCSICWSIRSMLVQCEWSALNRTYCSALVECTVCSQWARPKRKSRKETKHRSCFIARTRKGKWPRSISNKFRGCSGTNCVLQNCLWPFQPLWQGPKMIFLGFVWPPTSPPQIPFCKKENLS